MINWKAVICYFLNHKYVIENPTVLSFSDQASLILNQVPTSSIWDDILCSPSPLDYCARCNSIRGFGE